MGQKRDTVWAVENTPGVVSFRLADETPNGVYNKLAALILGQEFDKGYLDEEALLENLDGKDHVEIGEAVVDMDSGELIQFDIFDLPNPLFS